MLVDYILKRLNIWSTLKWLSSEEYNFEEHAT